MQTFVPINDITQCGKYLDMRRLGKQRVETLQIMNSISGRSSGRGWSNHPATAMWAKHINGIAAYGVAICDEWISRGYKDTCREKIIDIATPDFADLPEWWGDERVHSSHRANLLRKLPEFYSQFGWIEDPEMPYFWPTKEI